MMRLTRRGEWVLTVAICVTCSVLLLGAAYVGQGWKQDRLEQEATR